MLHIIYAIHNAYSMCMYCTIYIYCKIFYLYILYVIYTNILYNVYMCVYMITAMETDDMYMESEQEELEENVSIYVIFHIFS